MEETFFGSLNIDKQSGSGGAFMAGAEGGGTGFYLLIFTLIFCTHPHKRKKKFAHGTHTIVWSLYPPLLMDYWIKWRFVPLAILSSSASYPNRWEPTAQFHQTESFGPIFTFITVLIWLALHLMCVFANNLLIIGHVLSSYCPV